MKCDERLLKGGQKMLEECPKSALTCFKDVQRVLRGASVFKACLQVFTGCLQGA